MQLIQEQAGAGQQGSYGLSAVGKPMTQLGKLALEVTSTIKGSSICRYEAEGILMEAGI